MIIKPWKFIIITTDYKPPLGADTCGLSRKKQGQADNRITCWWPYKSKMGGEDERKSCGHRHTHADTIDDIKRDIARPDITNWFALEPHWSPELLHTVGVIFSIWSQDIEIRIAKCCLLHYTLLPWTETNANVQVIVATLRWNIATIVWLSCNAL